MFRKPLRSLLPMLLAVLLAVPAAAYGLRPALLYGFAAGEGDASGKASSAGKTENAAAAPASYETGMYTLNANMNFREGPSLDHKVIASVPKGTIVLIDQISGVWGHTTFQGKEGWLSLEYSEVTGSSHARFSTGKYRTGEDLNFRSSAAEMSSNIIGLIPSGTAVTVTEVSGDWGKISYGGKSGWISLNYCSPYSPEEETGPAEETTAEPATQPTPAPAEDVPSEAAVDWLVLDISRHNAVENFDWKAVKEAGVKGVIIRVGGRGVVYRDLYDDVAFYQHYLGAKSVGLHVGAYFFSYAMTEKEAQEEAQMTISILRSCNAQLDMPVYIDIEDYVESDYDDRQHAAAGKAVCTKVADTFCRTIEEAGYYPGIYCNKNFAETLLDDSVFAGRSLWIAHYADVCGYTKNVVSMWQYGSSGRINGYSGQFLDVNRCYVNYPAIISGAVSYTEHEPGPVSVGNASGEPTRKTSCTEDVTESVVQDGTVYATRLVGGSHGAQIAFLCVGDTKGAVIGQISDAADKPDLYCSDGSGLYAEKLSKAKKEGGVLLHCCSDCGEILSIEYFDAGGCKHEFKEQTVTAATCSAEGSAKTVCVKCGFTGSESVLPKTDHSPGEMTYYAATDKDGQYYGQRCAVCGKLLYVSYNFIAGDVDGNLKVDTADARLTLRHAIGLDVISTEYQKNADVNNDGAIGPDDARLVLRRAVNLE